MKAYRNGAASAVLGTVVLAIVSLPLLAQAQSFTGGQHPGRDVRQPQDGHEPTVLENGVLVTGITAALDEQLAYVVDVPQDAFDLLVQISSGIGDADLYVRLGEMPTLDDFDCRSWAHGTPEACHVPEPGAGEWFVMIHAYEAIEDIVLMASHHDEPVPVVALHNGVELPLSGPAGALQWYSVDVAQAATNLHVQIHPEAGAIGDVDLYVRFGDLPLPDLESWDCNPFVIGNTEECFFEFPQPGTWYIAAHLWPNSGPVDQVNLRASWNTQPPAVPANFNTSTSGARMRPLHTLTWIGGSDEIDVWRNGVLVHTGANIGSYSQVVHAAQGASNWQVCNAGTPDCIE